MKKNLRTYVLAAIVSLAPLLTITCNAEENAGLKPIPKSRVEIKSNLDALKSRKPRFPIPTPGQENPPSVNNARTRNHYLPAEWFAGEPRLGGTQRPDELVDYELKTKCFWIVSRGNNCHYCLGHQEHKLSIVGLSDDDLASLDHDWGHFDVRTRKALALARKMTQQPQEMTDQDIEDLRPEFNDAQIVELVYTIARFNSTNRWTDSMGIAQDSEMRGEPIHFDTPTAAKWDGMASLASPNSTSKREMASADDAAVQVKKAASRKARVALPSVEETRNALSLTESQSVNDWHRAIAALKNAAPAMVANHQIMINHSELSPQLKLKLMRQSALWNHGWLSLAMAEDQLKHAKADDSVSKDAEKAALAFADKLTAKPYAISDLDIDVLKKQFTDRQVAQIVHVLATANGLDRFCETLGLNSSLSEK